MFRIDLSFGAARLPDRPELHSGEISLDEAALGATVHAMAQAAQWSVAPSFRVVSGRCGGRGRGDELEE